MITLSTAVSVPVGVLGEVLVAGGVEDVDLASPYSKPMTDVATEMPRCRSISMKSDVAPRLILFDLTAPATWIAPPKSSSFSVSVVLPRPGG